MESQTVGHNWATELNENPVCETAKETQMYRTVFWTLWERARVGWFGRMALKHVYYHMWNESPVQVQCRIQDARGWYTGMTKRDGMGREVGGGFKMGNMCTPVMDSCWYMAKPVQYCKVISLQLNKFILKNKIMHYLKLLFVCSKCIQQKYSTYIYE